MSDPHWNMVWSMGVPDIDDQHKLMLGLLKNVGEAAQLPDNGASALASLRKFLENTEQHFTYEEGVLERAEYPGTEGHRADHMRFVETVKNAIASLENFDGDGAALRKTIQTMKDDLQNRFTHHLVTFDMDYKWFLRDEGLTDPQSDMV